jgi:hypothetical protein
LPNVTVGVTGTVSEGAQIALEMVDVRQQIDRLELTFSLRSGYERIFALSS